MKCKRSSSNSIKICNQQRLQHRMFAEKHLIKINGVPCQVMSSSGVEHVQPLESFPLQPSNMKPHCHHIQLHTQKSEINDTNKEENYVKSVSRNCM